MAIAGDDTPPFSLCDSCLQQIELIEGPTCTKCGAPIAPVGSAGDDCPRCRKQDLRIDKTVALGVYKGLLRELVLHSKFPYSASKAMALGRELGRRVQKSIDSANSLRPDVVAPIPMHWQRSFARGGNHAELLAEAVARRLRVPLAVKLLKRTRNTPLQTTLSPSERSQNVRNALAVRKGYEFNGARVLMVDDVLTTGSTCSEAARVLKKKGAEVVIVAVIARGIGKW